MEVKLEDKTKYIIVRIDGDLSGTVICSELMERLKSIYAAGKNNLIIDMENVEYADSLAIGVLLFCLKEAEKAGGKLVLSSINPHIKKIIYVSKLHTRMEIFESLSDAENYAF